MLMLTESHSPPRRVNNMKSVETRASQTACRGVECSMVSSNMTEIPEGSCAAVYEIFNCPINQHPRGNACN